ncbi:NUDIX hydrolase [Candidatus Enterococcus murrayae]|uniref:NUDIX hydrolase n=1 Tax=Candidatus Enterococcus murrayae TaxID=2815321 RepID=A0ABS3HPM6_9ENTE|nr:NUDIX hydrolase [Enterococcus sp. MJM16]MBO0454845.1 NUDIX hydrolase [Enterococcus sp. MJM16]
MKKLIKEIKDYQPFTSQEAADKKIFLERLQFQDHLLTRENPEYHFSSSAWVVNPTYDKVLMVYHNIYQSYSWTGGHADGCEDLLQVAQKELEEETGLKEYRLIYEGLFAFDILPVNAHYKNGQFVKAHHHINTTYLFMAEENQTLRIKEDENSDVKWLAVSDIDQLVAEAEMRPYYHKMMEKALLLKNS